MIGAAVGQRARSVHIDRTDGMTTTLDASRPVYDMDGRRIAIESVPNVLADPAAWIDFATEAEWRTADGDALEPWQSVADEPATLPARARIYARAVVEVMVVYDSEEV